MPPLKFSYALTANSSGWAVESLLKMKIVKRSMWKTICELYILLNLQYKTDFLFTLH